MSCSPSCPSIVVNTGTVKCSVSTISASTSESFNCSFVDYSVSPNYYAAFDDNGTADNARCETNNSPARSSNAVYDTIYIDDGDAQIDKTLSQIYLSAKPLAASTAVAVSVEDDYDATFTAVTRPDGTSMNTTSDVLGFFDASGFAGIKVFRIRLAFTSNGASTAFVTGIGITLTKDEQPAAK